MRLNSKAAMGLCTHIGCDEPREPLEVFCIGHRISIYGKTAEEREAEAYARGKLDGLQELHCYLQSQLDQIEMGKDSTCAQCVKNVDQARYVSNCVRHASRGGKL